MSLTITSGASVVMRASASRYRVTGSISSAQPEANARHDVPTIRVFGPRRNHSNRPGSTSVSLPANQTGPFYLLVVADGDHSVAESNELNNVAVRFIQINGS